MLGVKRAADEKTKKPLALDAKRAQKSAPKVVHALQ